MKIKIIITTTDTKEKADLIAEKLINLKISPCVQIIPNIISNYLWKRAMKKNKEYLLIIKTISENVQGCKKHILELHNYDSPEIIVIDSEILNDKYRDWFVDSCSR